ncbi:MAG: hypothetical protein ACRCT1_07160 [Microcoleaceae cyanobacterium]
MNTVKVEFESGASQFTLKFDLGEIVETLKDKDFANCAECQDDIVAWAFEKWIEAFLEELEENPAYFIKLGNASIFKKHLYGKSKPFTFPVTRENLSSSESFHIMQSEEGLMREAVSVF